MGVTVWDRFAAWAARGKLEEGFEEGASIQIKLSTGETVPAEVRVFKAARRGDEDAEHPQTGLRALINGQSQLAATPSSSRARRSTRSTSAAACWSRSIAPTWARPRATRSS